VGLGFLPGSTGSEAYAVNADGSVVVGQTIGGAGTAFRWTPATGMQSIQALLIQRGVNLTGWQLTTAFGVSGDGNVMVGRGSAPGSSSTQAWIARLTGGTPGIITVSNAMQSVASLQGTVESGHGTLNANLGTLTEIAQHHGCTGACM